MVRGQHALPRTCTYSSSRRGCGLVILCSLPGVAFVASVSQIMRLRDLALMSKFRALLTSSSA
eukprot:4115830-Pyramimonas_sp.AAC.1